MPDADVAVRATGRAAQDAPTPPPRRTSMLPALTVLGLAVVIFAVFAVMALTTGSPGSQRTPRPRTVGRVAGSPYTAVPASHILRPIEQTGEPPGNVLSALSVPRGTVVAAPNGAAHVSQVDQYDATMDLRVAGSETQVEKFFRTSLPRSGWKITSVGTPTHAPGVQVLAQIAGTDGWFWELGVTVSPTTFTPTSATHPSGPPATGSPAGTDPGLSGTAITPGNETRFTIRLFQEPDDD